MSINDSVLLVEREEGLQNNVWNEELMKININIGKTKNYDHLNYKSRAEYRDNEKTN